LLKKIDLYGNPEILEKSLEKIDIEEGCLSFPKYLCIIERPKYVKVKY
jgi:peptide deformylase